MSEDSARKIENVLLVDDDANIRFIVETSLEGLTNWKVVSAESGEEAIKCLSEVKPDLVLLDIMMPDMDGTMIFEKIKERFGLDVPVIFLTAKVQIHEVHRYKSIGAAGVIVKPFDPMGLPERIKTILQGTGDGQSK